MRTRAQMRGPRFLALIGIALVLLILAACQDTDGSFSPTSGPPSTVVSSPNPSPSASSLETTAERDNRLAREALTAYWALIDELAAHPDRDISALTSVAAGQALAQRRITLMSYRSDGWTQTGAARLSDLRSQTTAKGNYEVSACVNVQAIDFVDEDGQSQVSPDRPIAQRFSYAVARSAHGFLVTRDNLKGQPC